MAVQGKAAAGLAEHVETNQVPKEQLRFAVVLNGGVSLAVWMGGVVLELDRLTKATRGRTGAYALMQQLTGCGCRADVISGTSAGGINGAALALTQVNRDADPSLLRDMWTEQGRIESLLRSPFRGQPTSLLQGDEYFLPRLHTAMEILAEGEGHREAVDAPIDLTITTTVLRGNQTVSVDSMGQQLPQRLHAGRFHWKRDHPEGQARDPFRKAEIRRTAHRLALAARASASFPFAFEPAFIPVGSPAHKEPQGDEPPSDEVRLRPDMQGYVESWGEQGTRNRSRYVIDGGALANTPTMSALEAIERMPAEGPVRRVMLLVFPHAPEVGSDPEDRPDQPPTVAGALTGFLGALAAQGSRTYVDALERHNLAAAGRRGTRSDILEGLGDSQRTLQSLSDPLYAEYQRLRQRRAARDLAAWRTGMVTEGSAVVRDLPPMWNFERVRSAAESAQGKCAELPYVPDEMPDATTVYDPNGGWGWGVSGALGITEAVSDLLRRMVWVMEQCPEYNDVKESRQQVLLEAEDLRRARQLTDRCWREQPALTRLPPDESYWALRLACYDHLMRGRVSTADIERRIGRFVDSHPELVTGDDPAPAVAEITKALKADVLDRPPGCAGAEVREHVHHVLEMLAAALRALHTHLDSLTAHAPVLEHWHRELTNPDGTVPDEQELLVRLLRLEIASTLLGDEVTTGASLPVELVQVSAQTEVPFARHTVTGDDKLGGMALARFGGFLKRSWRVNDWIWGRVDGATVLCRTVLDPERIRRTARLSGYVRPGQSEEECRALAEATVRGVLTDLGNLAPELTDEARARVVAELVPVLDVDRCPDGDLPSALPELAALFATALHLESVAAELPALARAIRADRVDGANPRSRGEVFLAEQEQLLARLDAGVAASTTVTAADRRTALDVFDRAGIGREPLHEESSSDLIIRTGSTAAAVISTVVDSDRSGLAALKPVTRSLRGAMLLPYWAITGLTSRQPLARSLALLGLALGGVLLALSLFDALPEGLAGPAAALGAGALLAAFAYAALRTGSLLHGVVLLTPVVPLVTFALTEDTGDERGGSILVAVVALALGLMLLGSLGFASRSVWAALDRVADARGVPRLPTVVGRMLRRLLVAVVIVAVALLVAAVVVVLVRWVGPWAFAPERVLEVRAGLERLPGLPAWGWGLVVLAGVMAVASVVAHLSGRRLQVLAGGRPALSTPGEGDSPAVERPAVPMRYAPLAHADAVAAGWSVLYGTVYLVGAYLLTLEGLDLGESWWRGVAFATAVLFAAALLLVVPVWLPWRALRAARRDEAALVRTAAVTARHGTDVEERHRKLAEDLVQRHVSYRCFVEPGDPGCGSLTTAGEQLEQRLHDCRAAVALRATVNESWLAEQDDPAEQERQRQLFRAGLVAWLESGLGAGVSQRPRKRAVALRDQLESSGPAAAELRTAYAGLLRSLDRDLQRVG